MKKGKIAPEHCKPSRCALALPFQVARLVNLIGHWLDFTWIGVGQALGKHWTETGFVFKNCPTNQT